VSKAETSEGLRPVRVAIPVHASFAGASFTIREFTANLSVGGVFIVTESVVLCGTQGTLKFRLASWEDPFTLKAEVVRIVSKEEATADMPCGLGIRFLDTDERDERRLRRIVDGIHDGSVAESIRRSIREEGKHLLDELRRRPVDQKIIFALFARPDEIDALIRDGNQAAMGRMLENPRLTVRNVRGILRDTRTSVTLLLAIRREVKWMSDPDVCVLFCMHPNAPIHEVLSLMNRLPLATLEMIACNISLHPQVRSRAKQLVGGKSSARR